jgi:hypothetical protein
MNIKQVLIAVGLGIVVAAAAGFGGYTMGMRAGQTQATNTRAAFLAARGGNGQGASGGQFGAANANFAVGQVKSIDGSTVQLSTASEVLTVKLSDKTTISKTDTGTAADIKTGDRITVQGTRGADGAMTAERVQLGAGLAGMPGGAPGGNGQTRQNGAAQTSQGAPQDGNAPPPGN